MKLVKIEVQCIPFLDKRRKRKDGKSPIFISVTYKSRRKYVPTGILLMPELWDEFNRQVKGDDTFAKRNNKLLFARLLELRESTFEEISLSGHRPAKVIGIYQNKAANLKKGGADESK